MRRQRTKNLAHDDRAAAALELALVLPLFLAVVYGVIGLGTIFWTYNSLQYVADMLSRCYAIGTCTDADKGTVAFNSAANIWPSATAAANEIQATNTACGNSSGFAIRITITHSMTSAPLSATAGYFSVSPFTLVPWPFTQLAVQSCFPKPA